MRLKTITKTIENISKRKLSIQFSLDGFSFCISNFEDTIYHFSKYSFDDKINTPEILLERIKRVFKNDNNLQDDFESVQVIHQNNLNTLVPSQYFQENSLKNYLDYNIKTISTDFITYDNLDSLDIKNVYVPYVNINNFLFQNFGEFDYHHHSTVLIGKLSKLASQNSTDVFVNLFSDTMDVVVFHQNMLQFYNSFEFETKEDFIYHILFIFEQLKLDPNKIALNLLGEIEEASELYKIAYTYIRTINFLEVKSEIIKNEDVIPHSNYILLG